MANQKRGETHEIFEVPVVVIFEQLRWVEIDRCYYTIVLAVQNIVE